MAIKQLGRIIVSLVALAAATGGAAAAKCGNDAGGYGEWLAAFSAEAKANGVKARALKALAGTSYATKTIAADRNQKSFKLTLAQFMQKRGAASIASKGRSMRKANAGFYEALENKYGVPAGPLLAIAGYETGFGGFTGNQNTLSAVATLAYDCRRTEFFTDQLYAMLKLIDRGTLSGATTGAMHGEIGQTQFLPKSVLNFAVDGNGDGKIDLKNQSDALASTANYLRAYGWRPGAGYKPGQPNFAVIQAWNAASVYQQAIAITASEIDGN